MPIRRRTAVGETSWAVQRAAAVVHVSLDTAPGTRSFMRFNVRSTVVLPHPDGPMKAVISFS